MGAGNGLRFCDWASSKTGCLRAVWPDMVAQLPGRIRPRRPQIAGPSRASNRTKNQPRSPTLRPVSRRCRSVKAAGVVHGCSFGRSGVSAQPALPAVGVGLARCAQFCGRHTQENVPHSNGPPTHKVCLDAHQNCRAKANFSAARGETFTTVRLTTRALPPILRARPSL